MKRERPIEEDDEEERAVAPRLEVALAAVQRAEAAEWELPWEIVEIEILPNVDSPVDLARIGLTNSHFLAIYYRVMRRLYERHFRSPITGQPYSVAQWVLVHKYPRAEDITRAYALMGRIVRQTLEFWFRSLAASYRSSEERRWWKRGLNALAMSYLGPRYADGPSFTSMVRIVSWMDGPEPVYNNMESKPRRTLAIGGRDALRVVFIDNRIIGGFYVSSIDLEPFWRHAPPLTSENVDHLDHLSFYWNGSPGVDAEVAAAVSGATGQPAPFPIALRTSSDLVYYKTLCQA